MKIYDSVIRQLKIKNAKDVVILLMKLGLVAIIADEIYNAIHILPCRYGSGPSISGILSFFISRILFFFIIYIIYRIVRRWKRKGNLKRALTILIIIGASIWMFNGSVFFIYYFDGPYWGKVVDADTGEPIAGANVMALWQFEFEVIKSSYSFADARETMTDDKGRFFLSPARQIWFYPLSDLYLKELDVYKAGYDSHPPRMQWVWTDAEKKKWKKKLVKLKPNYDHERDPSVNYSIIFKKLPKDIKCYKPTIIRLNKTLSKEEKLNAKSGFPYGGMDCEYFKIRKFEKALGRRSRQ